MFKRSAFTYGRGVFANTADVLKNPKQDILFRSLNKELLEHNMIITTAAKAKFINSHFYKIVKKVNEYKNAEPGTEEQQKLISEAKDLLIGSSEVPKDHYLQKVETLLSRWSKRITADIKSDRFLSVSKLEPRKYDAAPMCLVELKDLPLFDQQSNPTYGNLYIWMVLEGLINNKADKAQKKQLFKELHDYLSTMSETEQISFFENDLMKVRELIAKRNFDATAQTNIKKQESIDEDDNDTENVDVFNFDSSLYTESNKKLENEYKKFVKNMERQEAQKPKADIKDLGKLNESSRSKLNIISNVEY